MTVVLHNGHKASYRENTGTQNKIHQINTQTKTWEQGRTGKNYTT